MSDPKWSYSRAHTYSVCPKAYKLIYIDHVDKRDNAFASWGSLMHKCLELYFKGELFLGELVEYYEEHYEEYMTRDFPYNKYVDMDEDYYNAGIEYLSNFIGLDSRYEVVGVEKEIDISINGNRVVGFIDLILQDKQDGKYIVVDHKSAKELKGAKLEEYLNQVYLYSMFIKEEYGGYPKLLAFNLIKGNKVISTQFDKIRLEQSIEWFTNQVNKSVCDTEFHDAIEISGRDIETFAHNDWFCNNLCSARAFCKRSSEYEGGDLEWL